MRESFTKNLLTLVTGNAIAMAIPIALYPFLSRVFSPEDYAVYGIYASIFGFLEIASVGRYDIAVVLPKENSDSINIVLGGIVLALLYSLAVFVIILLFAEGIATSLNNSLLTPWLYFLPLGLFLISISKLLNNWLLREKKFKVVSFNRVSQKVSEVTIQLGVGLSHIGNGLIIGDLAGRLSNSILSIIQSLRYGFDISKGNPLRILINLKQYSKYPKFSVLPSFLNSLGGMFPVFIVSAYYTVESSGSFNFSRAVLGIPFALISNGVSQVLMQQISERKNLNLSIIADLKTLLIQLVLLSVFSVLAISLAGPELFKFVFGSKWNLAGEYTGILIFSYSISFIVTPFSILLLLLNRVKWAGLWQIFSFFANSTLWLLKDTSIETFLWLHVLLDLFIYAIYGLLIIKAVSEYERSIITAK